MGISDLHLFDDDEGFELDLVAKVWTEGDDIRVELTGSDESELEDDMNNIFKDTQDEVKFDGELRSNVTNNGDETYTLEATIILKLGDRGEVTEVLKENIEQYEYELEE